MTGIFLFYRVYLYKIILKIKDNQENIRAMR